MCLSVSSEHRIEKMHTALFFPLCSRAGYGCNKALFIRVSLHSDVRKNSLRLSGCLVDCSQHAQQWAEVICLDLEVASCAIYFLLHVLCQICASNIILIVFNKLCQKATVASTNFGFYRACLACLLSSSFVSSRRLKCIQILFGLLYLLWINLLISTPLPYICCKA